MDKDEAYRRHILEAIAKIERYIKNLSFAEFLPDELIQDGVVRELEIIGEASKNLSDNFKQQHPELPWTKISGTRDKLIHEYFGIDVEIVWRTISEDLKLLKIELSK